jgi:stearoyl-CoA desaturase (delta-9 desaturase)
VTPAVHTESTPIRTIFKERPISTSTTPNVKPRYTGVLLHQARRPARVPNWLKTAPFVFFHLIAIPAAFLVGVDGTALALLGATYFLRMFGITGVYHRYFAHRAYKTSRLLQFLLAWLGCSAMQKGPLWWSGHHREHHRHSDTPEDPHSPYETSFWWSHVGWILSDEHAEIAWDDVRDWARYPELCWLDRYHWVPGILLGVACFLIGGWSGLVWGFLISTILVYHATFTINSLSHLFGKRRYNTPDDSRNNFWLALITLGEGWHNNHHHYQSSANQGFFWWEIDISYYLLRLLGLCGLVWDIRKPGEKAIKFRLVQPTRP